MNAMPVAERMTAEEFFALPERLDNRGMQLVDGELVVHEPKPTHQRTIVTLLVTVSDWVRAAPARGEVILPLDVQVDDRNVYAPDLLWYAPGRGPADERERSSPVPDLAVEVRSPSTWRYDIGAKKSGYERSGLAELWLVDTAADAVLVFRRSAPAAPTFDSSLELARGDTLSSPQMLHFALALDALFGAQAD